MPPRRPSADAFLMLATSAVLAASLLGALVMLSPEVYWDVDPWATAVRQPSLAMSPTGQTWLHVASIAAAALALVAHLRQGGTLRVGSLGLALVGVAAVLLHMLADPHDLLRGGAFVAAASLGVAVLHLAEHDRPRRLVVATAVCLLLLFVLRSGYYVLVEHPMMLDNFAHNEEARLAECGWTRDSAEYQLFARRMSFDDATGAFGLSNVYASIVGAATALACAVTAGQLARRRTAAALFTGAMALAGFITVYLTNSKGGAVAVVLALAVLTAAWLARRTGCPAWLRLLPGIAVLLVLAAVLAVAVRGWVGPPDDWRGERSLLFRWQYWNGAASMLAEQPARLVTGTGPSGFARLYPRHRDPRNPEDVQSAHNVFVDYGTTLGVGGVAWSALLLAWLWRAGRSLREPGPSGEADPRPLDAAAAGPRRFEIPARDLAWPAALATVLFGIDITCHAPGLVLESLIITVLGAGALAIGGGAMLGERFLDGWWTRMGLFLAALVLLVHNQIEMTFFLGGATQAAWLFVAAAAARTQPVRQPGKAWRAGAAAGAGVLLVVVFIAVAAGPLSRQQAHLAAAAQAAARRDLSTTLAELDAAIAALPAHTDPYLYKLRVLRQWSMAAAHAGDHAAASRAVGQSLALIGRARQSGAPDESSLLRAEAVIQQGAAEWLDEPVRLAAAAEALRRVTERSPYNLNDHLRLADLLWRLDQRDGARDVYRQCLRISDWSYLDPARQLTAAQRARVEQRLSE